MSALRTVLRSRPTGFHTPRRLLVLATILVTASAAVAASAPGASGARGASTAATQKQTHKKKVSAHLKDIRVSLAGPDGYVGCGEAFFAVVPDVKGAASYVVNLKDTKLGDRSVSGPPFSADVYGVPIAVSKNSHLIGLTSGAGAKCTGDIFGKIDQRLKIKSAYAIVDPTARVVGTVRNAKGDLVGGVAVKVGKESATTDGSGNYRVDVDNGTYTVSAAKGFCVVPQGKTCRTSTSVKVKDSAEQVDFREPSYSISGTVKRTCASTSSSCSAKGIAGVSVGAKNGKNVQLFAATNSKGKYTIDGLGKGKWVLTPVKQGAKINPQTRSVTIGSSDKTGVDFEGCDAGATTSRVAHMSLAAGAYQPKDAFEFDADDNTCAKQVFSATVNAAGAITIRWDATLTNSTTFQTIADTLTGTVKNVPAGKSTEVKVADSGDGSGSVFVTVPAGKDQIIVDSAGARLQSGRQGTLQATVNSAAHRASAHIRYNIVLYPGGQVPAGETPPANVETLP